MAANSSGAFRFCELVEQSVERNVKFTGMSAKTIARRGSGTWIVLYQRQLEGADALKRCTCVNAFLPVIENKKARVLLALFCYQSIAGVDQIF